MSKTAAKTKRTGQEKSFPLVGVLLLFASLAFTVLRFGAVTRRMLQSLEDLGKSALYYFADMFGIYGAVQPTVTEIPSEMPSLLPIEWEVFKEKSSMLFAAIFDIANFSAFNVWFAEWAARLTPYLYFVAMIVMIILLLKNSA